MHRENKVKILQDFPCLQFSFSQKRKSALCVFLITSNACQKTKRLQMVKRASADVCSQSKKLRQRLPQQTFLLNCRWRSVPFTWSHGVTALRELSVLCFSPVISRFRLPPLLCPLLFDGSLHHSATLGVNLGIQPLFFVTALVLLLLALLPTI